MVNPSAARHLALVVGVLLCFFVYMGYVIRNRRATGADDGGAVTVAAAADTASPSFSSDARPEAPGMPLMTMGDGIEKTSSDRLTPIGIPSLPTPIGADLPEPDNSPATPGGLNLSDGLLAMGGNDMPSLRPPPVGSIEETSTPSGEVITGLVPGSMLSDDGSAESLLGGVSLPPPPTDQTIAGSFPSVEPPASALLRPGQGRSESAQSPLRPDVDEPPAGNAMASDQPSPQLGPADNRTPPPSASTTPPANTAPQPVVVPQLPASPFGVPSPGGREDSLRIYVVRPGDTLSRIADSELGSMALADNIYLLNRDVISNPDHLLVGTRIKLPPRETVASAAQSPGGAVAGRQPPRSAPAFDTVVDPSTGGGVGRRYRIAPGDTLSSIALRFYGSSSGWRFLHESNRQAIPDPNRLTVGTEIVVPPYTM
ncbi:MAG: LysM peptidoglycan-binding domain-containing protein [Planctomycetota bacterium]|jgi:nucleoid-associated protein YgaU|nr:LysM peptidoglycan-binding domain-containing protein [Planctomycetota bacterium]